MKCSDQHCLFVLQLQQTGHSSTRQVYLEHQRLSYGCLVHTTFLPDHPAAGPFCQFALLNIANGLVSLFHSFNLASNPLQSYYLAMSLQNMNQMRLIPKKDYVANRLVSGALQLARNTLLFLDETQLEQGQLDTTGEDGERNIWCPAACTYRWRDPVRVASSSVCFCPRRCAQRHGAGERDLLAKGGLWL